MKKHFHQEHVAGSLETNMVEISFIQSVQNLKIKELVRLRQSKHRKKSSLFIIEGEREILRAQKSGYQLVQAYIYRPSVSASLEIFLQSSDCHSLEKYEVSEAVFQKIAVRETTGGMLVLAEKKNHRLDTGLIKSDGLYVVLDGLEKPGNIGAILRTCDGVGVDGVLISEQNHDLYSPHAIRASLGGLFSLPVFVASSEDIYSALVKNQVSIISLTPHTSDYYFHSDLRGGGAVVLGSEAFGVSGFWDEKAHKRVKIPMNGLGDSLNVSVAGAILLYDIKRQMQTLSK